MESQNKNNKIHALIKMDPRKTTKVLDVLNHGLCLSIITTVQRKTEEKVARIKEK